MSPRAQEPRTVPSLHTSLLLFPPVTFPCRQTRTPWDGKPISTPLPSSPTLRNPSFPFSSAQINCRRDCHRFFRWVVSLSPVPSLSSTLYSQRSFTFRWFLSFFFFFKSLQWKKKKKKTDVTLKRVPVPLKTWRGRRALFERLVFHVTNRRQAVWITPFFFFWPVITKISTGLNASNLGEWKWEFSRWKENRPSGKVAWFVFDAPGLTRALTLTGSFIQTLTKSPGTWRLRHDCVQPSWSDDAKHLYFKLSMTCHCLSANPELINNFFFFFLAWMEN